MANRSPTISRRAFCAATTAALLRAPSLLRAESQPQPEPQPQTPPSTLSPTHPDIAALDHDRILAAAAPLLPHVPAPITDYPSRRSPGTPNDFYSEPENAYPDPASPGSPWQLRPTGPPNPNAFTDHRDLVFNFAYTVAALAAAFALTQDDRYATRAAAHLRAWFLTPATRMNPSLELCDRIPHAPTTRLEARFEGILATVPLAEVAQAIPFLAASTAPGALTPAELTGLHAWFAAYLQWLADSRLANLARDNKDHHASSWLFQSAAFARFNVTGLTSDDATLEALRHRFRATALRAQVNANGFFPHELSTPNPYRNSLLNLDLLAAACDLLSTRFESAWDFELQDGPGMRAVLANLVPFIARPASWPYPADAAFFKLLPGRRPSLLFAGRAYKRPEYTNLWQSLPPIPATAPPEILRSLPITQPLLWIAHPKPVPPA
jgi:hypothetical protein